MEVVLRVVQWEKYYENNRTRELKRMAWVPMPNKFDGDGYTALLNHENGTAHFGAWCALIEVASRCEIRGTLLRGGGLAHDNDSLSRITRIPVEVWEEAIPRLVSIGWIEKYEIPQEGATAPHPAANERNGTERNGNNTSGKKPGAEPAVKRLIDFYHTLYVQKAGQKPTVTGQWGRNLKTLLRAHTEDTVQRVINYFFDYPKRTQWGWNKFMAAFDNLLPGATGRRAPPGPAGDGWKCPHCGHANRQTGSVCFRCHRDRDDAAESGK